MTETPLLQKLNLPRTAALVAGLMTVTAVVLMGMGRQLWCKCASPVPWSWDVWSMHNSQHVMDPYIFTHMLHGLIFFGALYAVKNWVGPLPRIGIAVALECAWEILENTNMVVNRYRENTASLDYFGDSVINSMSDVLACLGGYAFAASVPGLISVAAFFLSEAVLAWWIRDNLILNVIMLFYPIEAIKEWQTALGG
jgi:hypothetical protein